MKEDEITKSRPFGQYTKGTLGHVLNSIVEYGIPLTIAEDLKFTKVGFLNKGNEFFANYKHFDDLEQPLFRFADITYSNLKNEEGFQLTLSVHDTPGLVITGSEATPEVHDLIQRCLTNFTNDPFYKLHKDAGAFFQGGYGNPDGKWFYVEFWNPEGAMNWLKAFNAEYKKLQKETE